MPDGGTTGSSASRAAVLRALGRTSARTLRENPRLRRVVESWGLWVLGDWALLVLLSVSAYDRGGTSAVAVVGAVRMIPGAVAGPILSPVSDRVSRPRLLFVALVSCAVLAAAVPVGLAVESLAPLFVLVGTASVMGTLLRPAINGLIPQVVDRPEQLTVANSAYSTVEAVGSLIGPLLAGALVAAAGTPARYVTVSAVFALAAAISLAIRTAFKPAKWVGPAGRRRVLEPIAGFRTLVAQPRLRGVFVVFMAQTTTRGLLNVLLVALAVSLPQAGLASTGVYFAALGAGGIVGGMLGVLGGGWRPALPFVLGMSMWGLPLVVIAAVPEPVPAWLALMAVGVGNALGDVSGFTLLHRLLPDHVLGRAFGAFWAAAAAAQALGSAMAAPLLAGLGLRAGFLTVGIAMTIVVLLSWHNVRRVDADLMVDEHDVDVLRRCSLLAPLTRVAIEQLTRAAAAVTVDAATAVVEAGQVGATFFVIDSGCFDAEVDGAVVRRLGPGDCFGEIAALNGTPRTATVIARTPSRLLRLAGADFVFAVTGHRAAEHAAFDMARERLARGSSSVNVRGDATC